ncbi:MAG: hypothetical protein HQK50_13895 [Oligoflexia bacterium]|nr:hypothetical protein [Oligoflexia bacterium]MBF0366661.1 hypothetical protein [Oligoflexia bacterium]
MKKILFSCLMMVFALTLQTGVAKADDVLDIITPRDLPTLHNGYCDQLDFHSCNSTPECFWDTHYGRCDERGGGNPYPNDRSCSQYYDQYRCQMQPDCRWDFHDRSCLDRWDNPNPGPGPGCYQFRDPRVCERAPGCDWDYRRNRCEPRDNPGPGAFCNNIYDRRECERNYQCDWDTWSNRCENRRGGHDNPRDCRFLNNANMCMNTPGCAWDHVRNYCIRRPF